MGIDASHAGSGAYAVQTRSRSDKNVVDARLERTSPSANVFKRSAQHTLHCRLKAAKPTQFPAPLRFGRGSEARVWAAGLSEACQDARHCRFPNQLFGEGHCALAANSPWSRRFPRSPLRNVSSKSCKHDLARSFRA